MRTLNQVDLTGKRVLIRCAFNVPMKDGKITDDSRIRAAIPTIKHCIDRARQVVICSHLGRPKAQEPEFSLRPIASHLQELLKLPVNFSTDLKVTPFDKCVLLENMRFFPGEKTNDPEFVKQLASLADVVILDAFADMHRADASTFGIAKALPSYAGLLVQREVTMLERVLDPMHPFVAIFGFAKIADKLTMLERLLERVDRIMLGGAVIFTFYKAANLEVGKSLVEPEMIPVVQKMLRKYGTKIQLPTDVVVGSDVNDFQPQVVDYTRIPADKMGLDIGPISVTSFCNTLQQAKTVFWNGPVGVFEHPPYDEGTVKIAQTLATLPCTSVVGGGDTVAAVHAAGVASRLTHVSTGGGAALEFLAGEKMAGLEALGYYDAKPR